jgi:hypothetical protein
MLPPTPSKIKGQRGFLIDFDYAKSLPPLIPIDEKGQPSSEQQPSLSLKDSMASINSFTVIPEKHHDRTVCRFCQLCANLSLMCSSNLIGHKTLDGH